MAAVAVVGTVGGIYGIGGGSILAPILLALGYSAYEVAARDTRGDVPHLDRWDRHLPQCSRRPTAAAIAPTGRSARSSAPAGSRAATSAPDLQRHLPERALRRLLGLIACLVAARYIQTSIQPTLSPPPRTSRPLTRPAVRRDERNINSSSQRRS